GSQNTEIAEQRRSDVSTMPCQHSVEIHLHLDVRGRTSAAPVTVHAPPSSGRDHPGGNTEASRRDCGMRARVGKSRREPHVVACHRRTVVSAASTSEIIICL